MNILFKKDGNCYRPGFVEKCVRNFGKSYNETVCKVINNSSDGLNKEIFRRNVAMLMPNFMMGRAGPFRGVTYMGGNVRDPRGQIMACWDSIGKQAVELRKLINQKSKRSRRRVIVETGPTVRKKIASQLMLLLSRLSSVCWTENSFGLVGASKVLFAVLPEVALPIDNAEWKKVFRTINYNAIITTMADEIQEWEMSTGAKLDSCDPDGCLTLPGIYNIMAMKARP
jgi:hypothetical protein